MSIQIKINISRYETADLQRCRRPFRRTIRRYNQLQHHVDGPSNQSTSPSNEETKAGIDYQYWIRCRNRICADESDLRSLESHSQHYLVHDRFASLLIFFGRLLSTNSRAIWLPNVVWTGSWSSPYCRVT